MLPISWNRFAIRLVMIALLLGGAGAGMWYALRPPATTISSRLASSGEMLSAPPGEGFQRVSIARDFTFPTDHGPHREYQTEWWYYTGNLTSDDRRWGYQLTFFRQGLISQPISRTSEWAAGEAYMAHFTLTDVERGTFYAFDRLTRGGRIGIAGAEADPYHVFVEGWSASGTGDTVALYAESEGVSITLNLTSAKPATLQGERGLSQKSSEPGNASYYYSLTHLETTGMISVAGQAHDVTGVSWFDHEWGTSALGQGQTGWDWFGLHLGDGRDLMWGQLRRADGSIDVAHGSLTAAAAGAPIPPVTPLQQDDVRVTALDTWESPTGAARYPSRWRIEIPSQNIDIELTPLVADQELRLQSAIYWEGAVAITGTVSGFGYVEMTGYNARQSRQPIR